MPIERTLLEMARDVAAHSGIAGDAEAVRDVLNGAVHDALAETWGPSLGDSFEEALKWLKEQLKPVENAFSEIQLRRIIGTEIAWVMEAQSIPRGSGVDLAKKRSEYVAAVTWGADPLLDPDAPQQRVNELVRYLRAWADFPAFGFGIPALDDATGGILPGEICVVTGAPGTMKTSLALAVVDDCVSRTEAGLAYYASVDMSPREIAMRILERETGTPESILRAMAAREAQELSPLRESVQKKYNGRLAIHGHTPSKRMTIDALLHECLKRQPQLVVLDYLTRLKEPGQSDLEFVELAMPRMLDFAHQYETSFLILSQMSRSSRSDQAAGRIGGHGRGGGIVEELAHTEIELLQQGQDGGKPLVIAGITKARRGVSRQYFALGYDGPTKRFDGTAEPMARTSQRKRVFETAAGGFYSDFMKGGQNA